MEEVKAGSRVLQCPKCGHSNFAVVPLSPQPLDKLVGSKTPVQQFKCLSCGTMVRQ